MEACLQFMQSFVCSIIFPLQIIFPFLKKILLFYLVLERGVGREEKGERNITVWLPLVYTRLGTWPAAQACALTGNQTRDPLVQRPALNLLRHTSQGYFHLSIHVKLLSRI